MIFSSPIFIVFALPVVLAVYFLFGRKNIILLTASILFYSWGEFHYTTLLIISIVYNYIWGILIARARDRTNSPILLYVGVAGNIFILGYFKYASFLINSMNPFISLMGFDPITPPSTHLPLGISFFTFQAITYLFDTYRGHVVYQRNLISLALYISFFPQLIAGPIVRYSEIADALKHRIVRFKPQFNK